MSMEDVIEKALGLEWSRTAFCSPLAECAPRMAADIAQALQSAGYGKARQDYGRAADQLIEDLLVIACEHGFVPDDDFHAQVSEWRALSAEMAPGRIDRDRFVDRVVLGKWQIENAVHEDDCWPEIEAEILSCVTNNAGEEACADAARKPEAEDTQPERSEGHHVLPDELVEAVRFAAAVIDGCLVNDEDAMNSMEAARNGLRKALPLPLLLPTEEQVRADEREKCARELEAKAAKIEDQARGLGLGPSVENLLNTATTIQWCVEMLKRRER